MSAPRPSSPGTRAGGRARAAASSAASNLPAVAAAAVVLFLAAAVAAPGWLAPADPLGIEPAAAFSAPGPGHLLGTDESGRDIYTRIVHGARSSLTIGVAATGIGLGLALLLGVPAGLTAGRRGRRVHPRWVDASISRVLEVLFALPGLLLALVFIAFAGPGVTTTVVAVGLSTAPGYARIIRTQVMRLRDAEMVQAARVLGRSRTRILLGHLLPNALGPVAVLATLGVGQAVVWASALSFLGLGAPPPAPEWGAMLSAGRTYLAVAWWMTVFPGLAIVLVAASATVLGRWMQRRAEGVSP